MSTDATILHLTLAAECLGDELYRRELNCQACVDGSHRDTSDTVTKAFDEARAVMEGLAKTRTHADGHA